jgi:co-chaperonin GroES (HSP10)
MNITAKNNTILLRTTYEPLRRLSRFNSTGETIETKEFGAVKVHGNQAYVNKSPGPKIAWGEVLSVGPGAAWMGNKMHLPLEPGDVVGYEIGREVSTKFQGEELFFLTVDAALCKFNPGQELPEPLTYHVLTREEPGAGERFTFSGAAAGRFILPRTMALGTLKVADSAHSNVKFTVERVVAVGPGGMGHEEIRIERSVHEEVRDGGHVVSSKVIEKVQRPVFILPERDAVGRLAVFLFTMSVDVYVQETRYRLTNWGRVRALAEED